MNRYETEAAIAELVRSFEDRTISREDWKHPEHLIVALYLVEAYGLTEAVARMRSGLLALLRSYGVDLEKEMPYHETLTVFWMRTVYAYSLMKNGDLLSEKAKGLVPAYSKDLPLRFYTEELLFSDRARVEYVEPDIRPLDHATIAAST